jgi:DDE superfamily endonuclease/Fission yeast centromere protein N-terminal domain/Tc5 transposase DNA-binding domain
MSSKKGISIDQRRALRKWAHQQSPKPSQKQCIEWFYQEYQHRLSQSTVSESLSKTFAYLDGNTNPNPTSLRVRGGNWPEIENILWDWQIRFEQEGGVTSGDILQRKAKQIWLQHPRYKEQPCPEFSARWLERFKQRHSINGQARHGEAGSVVISTEDEMKSLQTVAGEYPEEDIYNMDEAGLFWKMLPSRGLHSVSQPGVKEKPRVSLVVCVNATGTDRRPIWIIGNYKTPRALQSVCVATMGGRWRWNRKAWINTMIMCEWLQEFYQHIGITRQVLLTMDNFSAHYSAIELCPPPSNIRVCWLPANSTSRYQPLNQGIIQNLKACYRQHWLQFTLQSLKEGNSLNSGMNIRLAVRWIIRSWHNQVSNTTIYNCFRKSTLVSNPITLPTPIIPAGLSELYTEVARAGNIQDAMLISNFLNPVGEDDEGGEAMDQESILQEVIDEHLGPDHQDEAEEEDQLEESLYTAKEAFDAVQVLIEYAECQDSLSPDYLRLLERLETAVKELQEQGRQQGTLDGWLM